MVSGGVEASGTREAEQAFRLPCSFTRASREGLPAFLLVFLLLLLLLDPALLLLVDGGRLLVLLLERRHEILAGPPALVLVGERRPHGPHRHADLGDRRRLLEVVRGR